MSQVTYEWVMWRMNESYEWEYQLTWMRVSSDMNESIKVIWMSVSKWYEWEYQSDMNESMNGRIKQSRRRLNQVTVFNPVIVLSSQIIKWQSSCSHQSSDSQVKWQSSIKSQSYQSALINVTWLIQWVMSHINESCHISMSHVIYQWVTSGVNESCHISTSHVTYQWSIANKVVGTWVVSHMNE